MFPRLKTVVLEYEGEFDSSFRIDDGGDKYTFDHWTRDTEKELMEEWAAMGRDGGGEIHLHDGRGDERAN